MSIENWKSTVALPVLYRELQDLEAFGFTVAPLGDIDPPELWRELRAASSGWLPTGPNPWA